jgi:hypothetical protein
LSIWFSMHFTSCLITIHDLIRHHNSNSYKRRHLNKNKQRIIIGIPTTPSSPRSWSWNKQHRHEQTHRLHKLRIFFFKERARRDLSYFIKGSPRQSRQDKTVIRDQRSDNNQGSWWESRRRELSYFIKGSPSHWFNKKKNDFPIRDQRSKNQRSNNNEESWWENADVVTQDRRKDGVVCCGVKRTIEWWGIRRLIESPKCTVVCWKIEKEHFKRGGGVKARLPLSLTPIGYSFSSRHVSHVDVTVVASLFGSTHETNYNLAED